MKQPSESCSVRDVPDGIEPQVRNKRTESMNCNMRVLDRKLCHDERQDNELASTSFLSYSDVSMRSIHDKGELVVALTED